VSWRIVWCSERPGKPRIGNAWFWHPEEEGGQDYIPRSYMERFLSASYLKDDRPPIMLVLPGGYNFCIDWAWWVGGEPNPSRKGWSVSLESSPVVGGILLLSISPSINCPAYHGFVGSNGVPVGWIGDDVSGRTFEDQAI
jgi:hypothetical protein